MRYRILTALCIAALAIGCNKNEADSDENIGLFDEAVSVEMPYLGFYDTDTKSGVIDFEAEKANYDMDNSSSNTMVFASIECTDFPTREYVFESGRQLKSVRMVGASERTVWNSNLIDVLAGMGYTRTSADKDMVTLDNAKVYFLQPDNQFATKLFLERQDTTTNYLIYAPFPKPDVLL